VQPTFWQEEEKCCQKRFSNKKGSKQEQPSMLGGGETRLVKNNPPNRPSEPSRRLPQICGVKKREVRDKKRKKTPHFKKRGPLQGLGGIGGKWGRAPVWI